MKMIKIITAFLVLMGLLVAPSFIISDYSAATSDPVNSQDTYEGLNPMFKSFSKGGGSSSSYKAAKKVDIDDDEIGTELPSWALIPIVIIILLLVLAIVYFVIVKK